jgi:hypothetical protein
LRGACEEGEVDVVEGAGIELLHDGDVIARSGETAGDALFVQQRDTAGGERRLRERVAQFFTGDGRCAYDGDPGCCG